MNSRNIVKYIALILIVSIILRFCYVLIHMRHECTHDDNCPVCLMINNIKKEFLGNDFDIFNIITIILIFYIPISFHLNKLLFDERCETMVGLKVELIN